MTTNTKNEFFWKLLQKNFLSVFNLFIIIFLIGLLIFISCQKEESLKIQSIKINNGWGYSITKNEKIIIKQTVIPVIGKNKNFQTEKEALAIGQLVLKKLNANNSPTITKNDLILLKIKI
ncbi:DUF4907 domain-containing protein [Flavobacterium taihuense]|uniref:DUF4907 domain-containing protein n=1 Tax=Flavobacterium taihuense TaxID=2857508 RepID=A0ABS6XTM7_9FLAO|nr:DUF4907 domain-containing protein [Flavobacterium taihuense]MBW4359596.1 DUF4907 domain-containing protein [Flavobacterium taihuense]